MKRIKKSIKQNEQMIIGITGTLGAGKGTVVNYLVSQKNFEHFSMSGYFTDKLIRQRRVVDRDGMRKIANEIRTKFGPDYVVKKLFEKANKSGKDAVIESIRNPKEADFIKNHGGYLFAVEANQKIRFKRIKSRGSEKDSVTFKEFKLQEEKEKQSSDPNAQNLSRCILMADYKFSNDSTPNHLYSQVKKVLREIKEKPKIKQEKYKRPSWDDYFMEVTNAIGRRGTCDRGRSGCIIAKDKQILATGYVGSPAGFPHCDEAGHDLRKTIEEDGSISLHCVRTVHAEQNAICQAAKRGTPIDGATVYVKMTPCRTCAMLLINCGIKRVYAERKYHSGAEELLKKAGVKMEFKYKELEKYPNQKG